MSSSSTEQLVDIPMPAMGTSVSEGTIVEWHKNVGDRVERDEPLCDISTDKIDSECPSPVAGVLAEILVQTGETVEVGTPLARVAAGGDPAAGTSAPPAAPSPESAEAEPAERSRASNGVPSTGGRSRRGDVRYSPVVSRMAVVHDIDLSRVPGSGRNGRVTKRDVLAYLGANRDEGERPLHTESPYRPDAPSPASAALSSAYPPGTAQPLSRMRRSIATAMRGSLDTAAACTTIVECDMSAVESERRALGMTALPLVAEQLIATLRDFGALNATLQDDKITRYDAVNLGVAVSLGADGLIVPVIRDAQDLSAEGLARRIKDLAARARSRKLVPDELQGATFTITSPGAYGAIIATPIINLPQVGILDLEAIVRRPVVVTDADGNESIAIRSMAYLCLSWDHRAIDGAYAAQFLTALRGRMESIRDRPRTSGRDRRRGLASARSTAVASFVRAGAEVVR